MNVDNNTYKSNYLSLNNKNWENVRSNSYYVINIKQKFKDDNFNLDINIELCPVCFNTIWSDTKKFKCEECKKIICKICMEKIHNYSIRNNIDYKCPCCRNIINKRYVNNYRQNRIMPLNGIMTQYTNDFIFNYFFSRIIRIGLIIALLLLLLLLILAIINNM